MKRLTCLYSVIVAGFLLAAFIVSLLFLAPIRKANASPARSGSFGPEGVIETDGTLDSTFDAGNFTNGWVIGSAFQSDGKLLIAGQFTKVHGVVRNGIARLNTDGTLDSSFDPGTGANVGASGVLLQKDGKIIVFGIFSEFNEVTGLAGFVRLNSNGSVDPSFNAGRHISIDGTDDGQGNATFPGYLNSAFLQPDGKIVVTGSFFYVITGPGANVPRSCVARFNSDGTFDPTYDPGAGLVYTALPVSTWGSLAVSQTVGGNAGKIIIEGLFDQFDGHPVPGIVRLNTDGSFDSTFDPGTATKGAGMLGLFVQSDDKLFVFGTFNSFNGVSCSNIIRLNSNGAVDTGFTPEEFKWYSNNATIFGMSQQSNGKIIVGGDFHSLGGATANNVVRLETNGTRDASFSGTGGGPSAENVSTIAIRSSDGKILLGGNFSTFGGQVRNNVALVNTDGSIDSSFAGLAGVADYEPNIWTLTTQPDGKILMTGVFTSFNGASHYNVLRLNPDATIDSSFNVDTDRSTRALLIQPDGKILIAGNFGEVNGVARGRIARVNSDGTLDPSFDPGTGPEIYIRGMSLDSDGNIYVGGEFTTFNGIPRFGIVKLSSTGAVDPLFNPDGGGADDPPSVWTLTAPDSAGRIVIAGGFSTYNGTTARRITRIDSTTGAIDPKFNPGGSGFAGYVYALRPTSDGSYYVGGSFTMFNGETQRKVARLGSDGFLDPMFADPALPGTIYALALQNGKVYAGGSNYPSGICVRLKSDGTMDPTFNTGTGFDISPEYAYGQFLTKISALTIQADGKLLVGGIFNRYNGTPRICLARLTGPLTPPPPSPTPSPTSSPTPPAQALNLSTRMLVQTGNDVGIGGFIIAGTAPKHVIVRGLGPSLSGIPNPLADPVLELHGPAGFTTITNDNWQDPPEPPPGCQNTGIAPPNPLEAMICATLDPGAYTAILRGNNGGTGVGLVEIYDIDQAAASKMRNLSTRAFVSTGNDIVIAGLILGGSASTDNVILRGIGPSLASGGISNPVADPTLELRDGNGTLIRADDNWQDDPTQAAIIMSAGLAPTNTLESAIAAALVPGPYTALLSGVSNGTGVGLVEVYDLANSEPLPSPVPTGTPGPPTPSPTPSPAACVENWDSVTAPALPPGWVAANPDPGDGTMWATTTTNVASPPNAVHIGDQDGISEKVLDRMGVTITSTSALMSFRNNFHTEFSDGICWDGYALEVSAPNISNGDFLNIADPRVGGSFVTGGYGCFIRETGAATGPINQAGIWSGNSGGYIDTVINMGPNLVGQTITLRFHMITDEAVAAPGVWIDNMMITDAICP